MWKYANCSPKCASFALQRLHEVQQLYRGKLCEPLLHILLLPLEEDPPRHLVQLPPTAHKVNAAAHRAEGRVGLAFEIDIPVLLAALQLPHVLAVLGGRHGPLLYGLSGGPPVRARVTFPANELSRLRRTTLLHRALLPQVRRGGSH